MADPEQRIVEEYLSLVDRSQQLFAGLRDLPQFGKQWQPYFQRTFEVYTKLWKFQQIHRSVIESKERYGLKRWEIGAIASRIGQLYYHYYLRTSETNYLHEAFVFYEAIRQRAYFKDVLEAKSAVLMVQKLRYYARFVVVCLLLGKKQLVQELREELEILIDQYIKAFKPADNQDWKYVLQEISHFLDADSVVSVNVPPNLPPISNRLSNRHAEDSHTNSKIRIQEAILIGNCQHQVKFSELTLDMFRMMQALERDPLPPSGQMQPEVESVENSESTKEERHHKKRSNPHKYLLYRPTVSQLLTYSSFALKELQENYVMVLYLSADGSLVPKDTPIDQYTLFANGGVSTSARKGNDANPPVIKPDCFYPGDVMPLTRKNLFLIVDSDNSRCFASLQSYFGKYLLCLLSPQQQFEHIPDRSEAGNLFTYFLYNPIMAFAFVSRQAVITNEAYQKCVNLLDKQFDALEKVLISMEGIPPVFTAYLQEKFLRLFILRFIFAYGVISNQTALSGEKAEYLPSSNPPLPQEMLNHSILTETVYSVAGILDVTEYLKPQA